jgi:SulP family sulfate permease
MQPRALQSFLPFLRWFPLSRDGLRADAIAGITVALILIPQSMAYAQLAGLPVVYGLYASFIPVIIASLWGSSNQLHTGPVAMLSLMSAAAVIPLAAQGSETFIMLSVMLALMVGILRLFLGVFKLGAIVNLLSSPVIVGFTNAAALIIGLSQLNKVLGVPFPRTESYLNDLMHVLLQIPQLHWVTLLFAAGAWILIDVLKRHQPKLPGILIAVLLGTLLSALVGFEKKTEVNSAKITDATYLAQVYEFEALKTRIGNLTTELTENNQKISEAEQRDAIDAQAQLVARNLVIETHLAADKTARNQLYLQLYSMPLYAAENDEEMALYRTAEQVGEDVQRWRFEDVANGQLVLSGGGNVVGTIPDGLPSFAVPEIRPEFILALLPSALVMALIGFMEATSISKAIASVTGERVDTSRELIGQGLANIAGSFFSSYTVSGSFSRSAVAANSGAKSGIFAIISALAVVLVLLFFTEYLYHLPQAVLAVIVMMAVFSLIRIRPLLHAWKFDRVGALIGLMTFIATLVLAPDIANGILIGIALTVLHYLIQTMRPRAEIVSRKRDGTLGGMRAHKLQPLSNQFVPVRFDGALTFINVAYFEDAILEAKSSFPNAKAILVICSGINEIDASGEEKLHEVTARLAQGGVTLFFSGLKHQVMRNLERSGLVSDLGTDKFFPDKETALEILEQRFSGALPATVDEHAPEPRNPPLLRPRPFPGHY